MRDSGTEGSRITAIVTTRSDGTIQGGGVPIFVVEDDVARERTAVLLAKMLRAMVHDLENGTYVIVRH